MNSLCKEYISSVRLLFPVMGQAERNYLKKLELSLTDYCAENKPDSFDTLCQEFGMPEDIVNNYFDNADIDSMVHRIRKNKFLRYGFIAIICATLIVFTSYCINLHLKNKQYEKNRIYSEETTIEILDE